MVAVRTYVPNCTSFVGPHVPHNAHNYLLLYAGRNCMLYVWIDKGKKFVWSITKTQNWPGHQSFPCIPRGNILIWLNSTG